MKLEFSPQISEKKLNHILWKSVQLEPHCSMRTERHGSANSRISQFCKPAQKSNSFLVDSQNTGHIGWGNTYCSSPTP